MKGVEEVRDGINDWRGGVYIWAFLASWGGVQWVLSRYWTVEVTNVYITFMCCVLVWKCDKAGVQWMSFIVCCLSSLDK